ncbi:hypothetical protein P152DRAFT_515013 [Eremomyces bilateralis CBS 781.70]|uniref:Uncharacterized protein n=1 Tax=Eremomyces bilateralis CBS 781.70 TaxID=1392243 RepID=A0A6G1G007_9PEZI|nr:uncharacterized protein P152DRAFT_515013 [Eremomyces bilateralis CBS 781.70]KAF1811447.1 hypothetical protein P152DRAFT_515013 [Eremomyces bilateralis CBS 781.70]
MARSQLCGELSLAPNCPAIVEKRQDDHADMWPNEVETVTATSVVWTVEAITSTVTTRVSQPNTSQPASTDSKTSSSSSTARSRSTTLTQTSTSEHLGHSTETTSTQSASTKSSSAKSSSVKSSSTQAPTMATLTYTTTVWVGETTTTVLVTRSATANTTTIQSASQSASSSSGRATVSYGESGAGTIKHTGECTAIFVLGAVVALAVGIGGFWF